MSNVRPYQEDAIDGVREAYRLGLSAPLVVMPTGTGKTILFAEIARRANAKRFLFLNHTIDLVHQTAAKLEEWCGEKVGIEQANERGITQPETLDFFEDDSEAVPRLCVASIPTLAAGRLDQIDPMIFDYVVFDEAHRAAAETWLRIREYFEGARFLGVTATPDRHDGKALGQIFDTVAFDYPIRQAIADGWLAPVKVFTVRTSIDLSGIRKKHGDLAEGELGRRMTEDKSLAEIAKPIIENRGDRPTVVFCAGVAHAEALAEYLCSETGDDGYAAALSGRDNRELRKAQTDRLAAGDLPVLTNCQLFTEGWDCPPVSLVVMARPTTSRGLYAQMIGRGTRIAPGKTDLVVMDFVHNASKHRLVHCVDIFQGDFSEPVVDSSIEVVEERAGHGDIDGAIDVIEALDLGFEAYEERRERVLYELAARDPFAAVDIDVEAYQTGAIAEPATEAQRALLERHGIKAKQMSALSKRQASTIIGRLLKRLDDGLCTPKQARTLAKSGIDGRNVTFEEAGAIIDRIAANGWRPIPGFSIEEFRRENAS